MIHWYELHDEHLGFSTYYLYDRGTGDLVKIFLQLRAKIHPSAHFLPRVCVGFSGIWCKDLSKFGIDDDGVVQYKGESLGTSLSVFNPFLYGLQPNILCFFNYLFRGHDGGHWQGLVFRGMVTFNPYLPKFIFENDVQKLAEICMAKKAAIQLTTRDASEFSLGVAILHAL